jgi:subtilisin family serine protease
MVNIRYGGKKGKRYTLEQADDLLVVRTRSRAPLSVIPLTVDSRRALGEFRAETVFPDAGVQVLRAQPRRGARGLRDRARKALAAEPSIQFAGRVLTEPGSSEPIVYTENLFVKFRDDVQRSEVDQVLAEHQLTPKRPLDYAVNAWFVGSPEGTGLKVFEVGEALLQDPRVELCHPELVRRMSHKSVFPQQWHLGETTVDGQLIQAHAHVQNAWELSQGEGITIAIIDDGIDTDHEEFQSPGKIVAPRDVSRRTNTPRPGAKDDHGTACAGVACADGRHGASGVAPQARLMPIRLASALGSQAEADAFYWAAQNGADVISCSWGPPDGEWWEPADPLHKSKVPLPDSTRLAIEWAVTHGRGNKGCVVLFAAGNGNESVDNDGYASNPKVIAVAASNDRGTRSAYSDFGKAVWCSFPSSHGEPSLTPGIWTTDRSGATGYNPGVTDKGDLQGHYTNDFGGTSSATPGVAGVVALMLSKNPYLRWDKVRDILKESCDRIDPKQGKYGTTGHSRWYGYGRVNARRAVELAASFLSPSAGEVGAA